MKDIPVLGFAGFSGTGKTTLLEKIIPVLTGRGLRLAVVKHDAHGLKFDHEGKDSKRFSDAGAAYSIVSSGVNAAVFMDRPLDPWEAVMMAPDVDLVLVEGYKKADFSQIGLCRKATGKGFTSELSRFEALVTDLELPDAAVPVFAFDDYEGIADFIMQNMEDFTHFNEQGRAKMVNVGEKGVTTRTATAGARVLVSPETFELIKTGGMKKGDVLTVAQIAGVMGAKKTPQIIPMCHPIMVNGIDLDLSLDEEKHSVEIKATVSCDGKTGVEMEALTAASVAALTVYDMCKAVQKDMVITDIRLLEKTGGVHGDFHRDE